jgi:cohesin complex subunit SA-1/2
VDYIGSLNHFTERFKPRLIEMATGDTELGVRVAVFQVLDAIDGHSLLEDEEREKLCLLVFDEDAKVRKAVSGFVRGVWSDNVDERLVGANKPSKEDRARAGIKALATLLVKWGKALDEMFGGSEEDNDGVDEEGPAGEGSSRPREEVAVLMAKEQRGRTALAVEALWDEVEPASDWNGLLDVLLLDHSTPGVDDNGQGGSGRRRGRANGKTNKRDSAVDEVWRLEEVEETVLLEVLVAALRRATTEVKSKKASHIPLVHAFM